MGEVTNDRFACAWAVRVRLFGGGQPLLTLPAWRPSNPKSLAGHLRRAQILLRPLGIEIPLRARRVRGRADH
jgi:hypothetical protein